MNGGRAETDEWVKAVCEAASLYPSTDIGIAPPFVYLERAANLLGKSGVLLGAQNCHWKMKGAFTGEISPLFLKDAGCDFVILGHSERRMIFGEDNLLISDKISAALEAGLRVILCVGETENEKEEGITKKIIEKQLSESLSGANSESMSKIDIAYEPVWAIGTGKVATGSIAQEIHAHIRNFIEDRFVGVSFRILYGGSVKPSNWNELDSKSDIDGALVGGVSLIPSDFRKLIELSNKGE